jgi:hypothetical protein
VHALSFSDPSTIRVTAASLAAMTALAGLAQPAEAQRGGARYAGSTSQGEGATLQVSRSAHAVRSLEATIVAFCGDRRPDRGIYQLADIALRGGAFAARQRLGSATGARAVLRATGLPAMEPRTLASDERAGVSRNAGVAFANRAAGVPPPWDLQSVSYMGKGDSARRSAGLPVFVRGGSEISVGTCCRSPSGSR